MLYLTSHSVFAELEKVWLQIAALDTRQHASHCHSKETQTSGTITLKQLCNLLTFCLPSIITQYLLLCNCAIHTHSLVSVIMSGHAQLSVPTSLQWLPFWKGLRNRKSCSCPRYIYPVYIN